MSGMPALNLSEGAVDFINEPHINGLLRGAKPDSARVREIIAKSLAKQALSVAETAQLLLLIHRS
jgi:2-iminoacetate synthase